MHNCCLCFRSDRIVGEDVTICGVPFKKGSIVWLPIYALHNDPDVWPEPQKFDPERLVKFPHPYILLSFKHHYGIKVQSISYTFDPNSW